MKIILFDGECNLCNSTIHWIFRWDSKKKFYFANLQGNYGKQFLVDRKFKSNDFDTFILYIPHQAYYTKSTALLKVISEFGLLFKILSWILFLIPKFIRDYLYKFISINRQNWFGISTSYQLKNLEFGKRFLQ